MSRRSCETWELISFGHWEGRDFTRAAEPLKHVGALAPGGSQFHFIGRRIPSQAMS